VSLYGPPGTVETTPKVSSLPEDINKKPATWPEIGYSALHAGFRRGGRRRN
jgi:hypothetical protein